MGATTHQRIELTGESLLAARAVVESALARYAQTIPHAYGQLDDLLAIVALSEVAFHVGRVGDPPRQQGDHRSVFEPKNVDTLVKEARWEVVFGEDSVEETWDADQEGYEWACAVVRWRVANARLVLEALGAEPGNPADLEQDL